MGNLWCLIVFENGKIIGTEIGIFEELWNIFKRVSKKYNSEHSCQKEYIKESIQSIAEVGDKKYILINTSKSNYGFPPRIEAYENMLNEYSSDKLSETGFIIRYREVFYQDYWVENVPPMTADDAKKYLQKHLKENDDFIESNFEHSLEPDEWDIKTTPF